MKAGDAAANAASIVAPSFGPAIVTIFGLNVPVLAVALSFLGLWLARAIAPPPLRRLTGRQEAILTGLLTLILFMIVTGRIGSGEPIGEGVAVIWGVGLGLSGLIAIEIVADKVRAMLRALIGAPPDPPESSA